MVVRVRFAPSPTGFLHLGGLRTALYNYLFAKANQGSFILRIEDTDRNRFVPGAMEKLMNILDWCGLHLDEGPGVGGNYGPYIQSQRLEIYKHEVAELLKKKEAYHCFCTEKRLDMIHKEAVRLQQIPRYDNRCRNLSPEEVDKNLREKKPSVVRFKLHATEDPFNDLVYGPINYNPAQNEADPVILKSDGFPTYHLANVVDDHLMGITHVLRGVEWQISTPKHILMYKAFGWKPPKFAHLPLIVNSDGSKLSKRQGDLHIEQFRETGYFPEALINFVVSMGGGFGKFKGIGVCSLSEMIEQFSLERLNVNSCRLELERLDMYNRIAFQQKLSNKNTHRLIVDAAKSLLKSKLQDKLSNEDAEVYLNEEYISRMLNGFQTRITVLNDIVKPEFAYVWTSPQSVEDSTVLRLPNDLIDAMCDVLLEIPANNFTRNELTVVLRHFAKNHNVDFKSIMTYFRMALSGMKVGPSVGEMLEVLGKEVSLRRLKRYKDKST